MKKKKDSEFISLVKKVTKKIAIEHRDMLSSISSEDLESDTSESLIDIENGNISLATILNSYNDFNILIKDFEKELGKFKEVKSQVNYNEAYQSSKKYVIYHFIKHDKYIKYEGDYNSYNDVLFNEIEEVRPVEKTIIDYLPC